MFRSAHSRFHVAGLTILALAVSLSCATNTAYTPECIAPANPGGGWDLTCRAAARVLGELAVLPRGMRVINMPGAGGGVAFANIVANRARDEYAIVAASTGTTLRLAQNQFGRFSTSDVRWVAAVAVDYGTIVVRNDAPWANLAEFVAAWRANPDAIVFGGGSPVGGQDHVKVILLARAAGLDPFRARYVPFDGGGEAMTTLLGGFLQAVPADTSEAVTRLDDGNVRVLAVMSPERLPGDLADVPTARELGFDVEWLIWRGFFAPGDISEEAYQGWALNLGLLAESPSWLEFCERVGLYPFFLSGAEFESYVGDESARFVELTRELGLAR